MNKGVKSAIAVCAILCVAVIIAVASYRVKRDRAAQHPAPAKTAPSHLHVTEFSSPLVSNDGTIIYYRVSEGISVRGLDGIVQPVRKQYWIMSVNRADNTAREVYRYQYNHQANGSQEQYDALAGIDSPFACSSDGRYLVIPDMNPQLRTQYRQTRSIYLYDSRSETLSLESVDDHGTPLPLNCDKAVVSDDGRYIVFSARGWLQRNTEESKHYIYLRDRRKGITRIIIEGALLAASRDGSHVVYIPVSSEESHRALEGDIPYLYNRDTEKRSPLRTTTDTGDIVTTSGVFAASCSGNVVAYCSDVSSKYHQVYLRNTIDNKMIRVSSSALGEEGNADSGKVESVSLMQISDDGQYLLFGSMASNLTDDDTNEGYDLYRYNNENGSIERVSLNIDNYEYRSVTLVPGLCHMSPNGRFVIFSHPADGLLLRDCQTAVTERLNVPQTGELAKHFQDIERNTAPTPTNR